MLSIFLEGATFDSGNIIGSIFPKPANLVSLIAYGANGPTQLAGTSTSSIAPVGSPTLNAFDFVGQAPGTGYNIGVPDIEVKSMILLCKFPSPSAVGMGVYAGLTGGDTLEFNLSTTFGAFANTGLNTQVGSTIPSTAYLGGDYFLFCGNYTTTSVQALAVKGGDVATGTLQTLSGHLTSEENILVGASYESPPSGFPGDITIAASGLWTNATLSSSDLLQLYAFLQAFYGTNITIG